MREFCRNAKKWRWWCSLRLFCFCFRENRNSYHEIVTQPLYKSKKDQVSLRVSLSIFSKIILKMYYVCKIHVPFNIRWYKIFTRLFFNSERGILRKINRSECNHAGNSRWDNFFSLLWIVKRVFPGCKLRFFVNSCLYKKFNHHKNNVINCAHRIE